MARVAERIAAELAHPARGLLAGKPAETIERLGEPSAFPWEVIVVIDDRREPRLADEKHFEGGVLVGRAYLYDYGRESVECASVFVAGSSSRLRAYDSDPKGARDLLLRDLDNEAMRAAAKGLVRVGPKLVDAGADARSARPR
jgi:hypothetical protein